MALIRRRHIQLAPKQSNQSISQIFLGIDFGTSYTKVSYSYGPTNIKKIHSLKWGDTFYKPTTLYIKADELFFDKPDDSCQEVKYFKYSIIITDLRNSYVETSNSFEEMCCVFFLAHVIRRSLLMVQKELELSSLDDMDIFINMGVPLENFDQENQYSKGLYEELLDYAVILAGGSYIDVRLPVNKVLISNLDEIYGILLRTKCKLRYHPNVCPELAAEIMLYHKAPSVPPGLYAIIDVGGGTVDMALFQKQVHDRTPYMYCHRQKVLPYGLEIVNLLRENKIRNENCSSIFRKAFSEMMFLTKTHKDAGYADLRKNKIGIPVFYLGGGAADIWYDSNISETKYQLYNGGVPEFDFTKSITSFLEGAEFLVHHEQRLIISQMLAQHPSDIEIVQGYPHQYISFETLESNVKEIDLELIQNELYGE